MLGHFLSMNEKSLAAASTMQNSLGPMAQNGPYPVHPINRCCIGGVIIIMIIIVINVTRCYANFHPQKPSISIHTSTSRQDQTGNTATTTAATTAMATTSNKSRIGQMIVVNYVLCRLFINIV